MSKTEVYDFLKERHLGVLATASKSGEPWAAAIYFTVNEDLNFYFLTKNSTTKFNYLSENARAAIVVVDNEEQATVQAYGVAEQVEDHSEASAAYSGLTKVMPVGQLHWTPPITKIHEGEYILMKLTPESLQFGNFKGAHPHKTPIEKII